MEFEIPYGQGAQKVDIPDAMDIALLTSHILGQRPSRLEDAIVARAMASPIESKRLDRLAQGKNRATIICSDHTRPVPSKKIIPEMLKQLRQGSPDIEITLLIATGFHRLTSQEELIEKFGEEIVEKETIIVHDSRDQEAMVNLGELPSGAPLDINRHAVETDLLLAEGFIEPHFFAGFSGGRKSVLPGVCAEKTVLGNHCADFIHSPYARTGVLENNPIHQDMLAAAVMANLQYIVNVVINGEKEVVAAFAGHPVLAHARGCAYLKELCSIKPKRLADIVITSNGGAPLDQNIYQAVKSMTAGEAAAVKDGVIIVSAACSDGTGSEDFYQALKNCESPSALLEEILTAPMDQTEPDQWETQILARVMEKHKVILVCDEAVRPMAQDMKLLTADNIQQAFDMALSWQSRSPKITIIPDGVSVIVEQPKR